MLLAHTHFHGHLRVTNHHPMKGEKEYQSLIPVIQHLKFFLPSCYTHQKPVDYKTKSKAFQKSRTSKRQLSQISTKDWTKRINCLGLIDRFES